MKDNRPSTAELLIDRLNRSNVWLSLDDLVDAATKTRPAATRKGIASILADLYDAGRIAATANEVDEEGQPRRYAARTDQTAGFCKPARKVNKLPFAEKVRVADWLRQQWATITETRPTQPAVAEQIKGELSIDIAANTVGAMVRDLGLTWPNGHAKNGNGSAAARVDRLEERIRIIEDYLRSNPRPDSTGHLFDTGGESLSLL